MATFPTVPIQRPYTAGREHRTVFNRFECGFRVSRAEWGSAKLSWRLEFPSLTETELNTLVTFYRARRGEWETFSFTDPETGATHTVRFVGEISESQIAPNLFAASVVLIQT